MNSNALCYRNVLVVGDPGSLRSTVTAIVRVSGGQVVGPATSVGDALLLLQLHAVDLAIVDADADPAVDAARELSLRRVPILFVAGTSEGAVPTDLREASCICAPIEEAELLRAAGEMLQRSPAAV